MTKKTIDILGSKWTIKKQTEDENKALMNCDGYCDWTVREIVVLGEKFDSDLGDKEKHVNKVMRHEIIHAFLFESGLHECSCGTGSWARNEEMVDWFARQGLKIYKAWQDAGCV